MQAITEQHIQDADGYLKDVQDWIKESDDREVVYGCAWAICSMLKAVVHELQRLNNR